MKTKFLSLIVVLLLAFLFVSSVQAQKKSINKNKAKVNTSKVIADFSIKIASIDPAIIAALIGDWKNQLGSTLKIVSIDATTGQLSGKYKSPSGTTGTEFTAIGWVNTATPPTTGGNNVAVVCFSVSWGNYGSVTTWNGYYAVINSKPTIVGQWLLSRANSNFVWDHILAGQDIFTK